jgi:CBS domain-containing protein
MGQGGRNVAFGVESRSKRAQHSALTGKPAGFAFGARSSSAERTLKTEERFIMLVRHILQDKGRSIVTIGEDATVGAAARLLAEKRIGAVLVTAKTGALAGILSERDVVRAVAADGAAALERKASDYMTRSVATCCEADTVEALMEMMTHGRFRHVPVLDSETQLCGVISIGDVVKTRIAETVYEANSLRDYISATA